MGDRTNCTLTYPAGLSDEQTEMIARLCEEAGGETYVDRTFYFEEVNHAELPQEIQAWFEANKVAFAWVNGQGECYGEALRLYVPSERDEMLDFNLIGQEIALTVSELAVDQIEQARWASAAWLKLRAEADDLTPAEARPWPIETVTLQDWRTEGEPNPDALDPPPSSIILKTQVSGRAFKLEADDGRTVMVEVEGPDLRVHLYSPQSEEPQSLRISAQGVSLSSKEVLQGEED